MAVQSDRPTVLIAAVCLVIASRPVAGQVSAPTTAEAEVVRLLGAEAQAQTSAEAYRALQELRIYNDERVLQRMLRAARSQELWEVRLGVGYLGGIVKSTLVATRQVDFTRLPDGSIWHPRLRERVGVIDVRPVRPDELPGIMQALEEALERVSNQPGDEARGLERYTRGTLESAREFMRMAAARRPRVPGAFRVLDATVSESPTEEQDVGPDLR